MTLDWVQDWTVTSVAIVAAVVILRHLLAVVQPVKGGPAGCSSCGSRPQVCAGRDQQDAAQTTVPVQVLRGRTAPRA